MRAVLESLEDVTPRLNIVTSSHAAIVGSLTDGSTETFWESGDEDKNKTKTITLDVNSNDDGEQKDVRIEEIFIHIDNTRDIQVSA